MNVNPKSNKTQTNEKSKQIECGIACMNLVNFESIDSAVSVSGGSTHRIGIRDIFSSSE